MFDEPNCYNEPSRLTHSMLIIGYGTYKGKDYWLVKNRYALVKAIAAQEPNEGATKCMHAALLSTAGAPTGGWEVTS